MATRVWKKKGAIKKNFGTSETPDLEEIKMIAKSNCCYKYSSTKYPANGMVFHNKQGYFAVLKAS